jgi:peptide/nickel transport system permease protein
MSAERQGLVRPMAFPRLSTTRVFQVRGLRAVLRSNPFLVLGAVMVAGVVLAGVFAPVLATSDPITQHLEQRLRPPAWLPGGTTANLFGTDEFGRDVLSRLLYGARVSLSVGLAAIVFAGVFGVILGLQAGYFGSATEAVLMRLADAQQAMPGVLLAIVVVAALGPSLVNLVIVLAIGSWVPYARIVFGAVRSVREREFVLGARTVGASDARIIVRHILPNIWTIIVVVATLQVGRMILLEAGLGFLGLGVPPPEPSWGSMLAEGRNRIFNSSWLTTIPGLAIVVTVLGINFLGEGLRRALDPRMRHIS